MEPAACPQPPHGTSCHGSVRVLILYEVTTKKIERIKIIIIMKTTQKTKRFEVIEYEKRSTSVVIYTFGSK
jgi:hypothetical protein